MSRWAGFEVDSVPDFAPEPASAARPARSHHSGHEAARGSAGSRHGADQMVIARLQSDAGNRAVAAMLSGSLVSSSPSPRPRPPIQSIQRTVGPPAPQLQRKGGGGGGTATGTVGIPGGESATPSDQDQLATGYAVRPDGQYDTPDGRQVSEAQAKDESKVVNSAGIYMAAYMARYDLVKTKYGLNQAVLSKLSASAGFLKQFKTGDVVLRLMDASDSEALAKITNSHYSHTGIIKAEGGQVMVLDSYPHGIGNDATVLSTFEDFFSDHHKEKIVNALVIRASGMNAGIQGAIATLIEKFNVESTSFDYDFKADNADDVMYCSELVNRVLVEAGSKNLPPNEFDATRNNASSLADMLRAAITLKKAAGTDTTAEETQLGTLTALIANQDTTTVKKLVSPGSLERAGGMATVAGFGRAADIKGNFKVTVLDATVPKGGWTDTPDPYVVLQGGLRGQTTVKDDTESPVWGETFGGFSYDTLAGASFRVRDSDVFSDDEITTVDGDIRPVAPAGQTFTLASGGTTLRVKTAAEDADAAAPGQAPRDQTPL